MLNKLVVVLFCLVAAISAMYKRQAGQNDWHRENLGHLNDFLFIDNNEAYTLSTDGVVMLFNAKNQSIEWKKQLPRDVNEQFQMRHLGRNLLVYSSERAILINSAGHILYEVHLNEHQRVLNQESLNSAVVVELIQSDFGTYSCLIKNSIVTVYRDYQFMGVFSIEEESVLDFVPLQLVSVPQLTLVAKIGDHLKSYQINLELLSATQVSKTRIDDKNLKSFTETARSQSLVVLSSAKHIQIVDPQTLKVLNEDVGASISHLQFSTNDDMGVYQKNGQLQKFDLLQDANSKDLNLNFSGTDKNCRSIRARDSEFLLFTPRPFNELFFGVSCKDSVSIQTGSGSMIFRTDGLYEKHGHLKQIFANGDGTQQIMLLFDDFSLHYAYKGKLVWQREESLSQINQVEVYENSVEIMRQQSSKHLDYVKHMNEKVELADVPRRIIQRYTENIQFMISNLQELFGISVNTNENDQSQIQSAHDMALDYSGFRKLMIVLAKPGKVHAISSISGQVSWSYYVPERVPTKVFVLNDVPENMRGLDNQSFSGVVGVIFNDEIHYLSPETGILVFKTSISEQKGASDNDKLADTMLVIVEGRHFIVYITEDALINQKPLAVSQNGLGQLIGQGTSVFFSRVDRLNKKVNGYKIGKDLRAQRMWSFKFDNEEFVGLESQYATQSDIEQNSFVPTAFSEDNIIYKYLDQNMFALTTRTVQTEGKYSGSKVNVYLVNGVTGKVVHQFFEKNVIIRQQGDINDIACLFNENYFAMAFQRQNAQTGLSQQELTVVELYANRQEIDTMQLLKDYYKGDERITGTQFSSYQMGTPLVVQESYILPNSVKKIALTDSLNHISSKSMILITTTNQVYQIKNQMYSARRPRPEEAVTLTVSAFTIEEEDKTKIELKNKDLPAYEAVIPHMINQYLSYDLILLNLKDIKIFRTRLESTSQVFVYGHDLFMTLMTPDNKFDMVQEDFNFKLLFAAIIGLIIANFALIHFKNSKESSKAFLTS